MKSFKYLVISMIFLFVFCAQSYGATYYVDAATGDDSSDGNNTGTAWATVAGSNGIPFVSGDMIYIKNGSTWDRYAAPLHISNTTGTEMITIVRYYLDETTAAFWTDAEILEWINKAIRNIANLTHCIDAIENITLVNGTLFYDVSTEYITIKSAIYYYETTGSLEQENGDGLLQENGDNILITNIDFKGLDIGSKENINRVIDVDEPVKWFVWRDRACIYPLTGAAANGKLVKLFMAARPYTITAGANIPTPAIYDAAIAWYATSQALEKSDQKTKGDAFLQLYYDAISKYRVDIADKPKPVEGGKVVQ